MTQPPSASTGSQTLTQRLVALLVWAMGFRFVKFGLVGASGTVVNLVVLFLGHKYLFASIESSHGTPFVSLALAILIATANNFTWNRLWTWADRRRAENTVPVNHNSSADVPTAQSDSVLEQFGKYAMASWFGIALQYGVTLWLSHWMYYLFANIIGILVASVSNYLANDRWTFGRRS